MVFWLGTVVYCPKGSYIRVLPRVSFPKRNRTRDVAVSVVGGPFIGLFRAPLKGSWRLMQGRFGRFRADPYKYCMAIYIYILIGGAFGQSRVTR